MKTVTVQGYDQTLQFPDDTPPEVIQKVVNKIVGKEPVPKEEQGTFAKIFPSLQRTGEIYQKEVKEGGEAVGKMLEEPTGKSVLQGLVGALRWGTAPITAVAKGIVREPIEQIPRALGAPEGITNFVGELAEGASYMVPYGKLVKTAMGVADTANLTKGVKSVVKETPLPKNPLEMPNDIPEEVVSKVLTQPEGPIKNIVKEGVSQDVIDTTKEAIKQVWKPSGEKRIGQELIDYVVSNKEEIPKVLEKYGLSADELAAQLKEAYSTSGRHLGQLGRLAKEIRKEFDSPVMKQLAASIEKDLPEPTTFDKFISGWKTVENVRRSLLVSQFATSARNIISQTGRLTIGSIDDSFRGMVEGLTSGGGVKETAEATLKGLGQGLDVWAATINRMKPSARKALTEVLEGDNALQAKALMFNSPVQDVVLSSKVAKLANTMNTVQEYFFRNIAFEARLNQSLRKAGMPTGMKGVAGTDMPPAMLEDAANYALEMTFAASPKSKAGQDIVKMMSHPAATSLLNPFPRFLWANALPFLKNFSPVGFLEAAKPGTMAKLASGNSADFAKSVSQATIGTIMMNTAMYIRNSEYGGEKWYEIKVNGKSWDTRAFAPLSSYLFLAESMAHPDKVKPADWASAMLSLNRIAGTGLIITDIIRAKKFETFMNTSKRLAGEYMGSFTTPARTFKDIYSAFDPEEAKIRDIREQEVLGPTIRNIPELSQSLPVAQSPLSVEPMKTEDPLLRQFSGLSGKTKTFIQTETDKLGLDTGKIYPKSGIPEVDRKLSEYMAPEIQQVAPQIIKNPLYQKLSESKKKLILGEMFKEVRKDAMNKLKQDDMKLYLKLRAKKVPQDIQDVFKEEGIQLPK